MREDGGDLETTRALRDEDHDKWWSVTTILVHDANPHRVDSAWTHLNVHEERPRGLDELLKLVLAELGLGGGVEEIDSESLQVRKKSGCVSF